MWQLPSPAGPLSLGVVGAHGHTCTQTHLPTCRPHLTHACMHTHVHQCKHKHTYAYLRAPPNTHIHVHLFVFVYAMCANVHMHTHVYMSHGLNSLGTIV